MKYLASMFTSLLLLAAVTAHAAGVQAVGVDHVGINVPNLQQAEQFPAHAGMNRGAMRRAAHRYPVPRESAAIGQNGPNETDEKVMRNA